MSSDIIIEAQDLAKSYRIWERPSARVTGPALAAAAGLLPSGCALQRSLATRAARSYRDFPALHQLSFTIRRGEATGFIGRNGSGKSTLLQLIAGTLTPTAGRVQVNGRISALLELGSGFNPDFTGRENVFLNGAILGLDRRAMQERFESIAAFADIGDFIEQPVKTYSSGMLMRLAFSVAVAVQPDVLIVDEALAVGDVFFTQKCFHRIREIVREGATLIFVSHDMAAVQNLCDRALLLNRGRLEFDGAPEDCVSRYFNSHQPRKTVPVSANEGAHPPVSATARTQILAGNIVPQAKSRHGNRTLEIVAAAVLDTHGAPTAEFEMLHRAVVRVLLRANGALQLPSTGLQLHDRLGNLVFAAGTPQLHFRLAAMRAGEEIMLEFRILLSLQPGSYTLSLDAAEYDAENPNLGTFHDRIGGLGPLTVSHHGKGVLPFYGIAQLPMEIDYA